MPLQLALDGPNSWAPVEGLGEAAAEPKELAAKVRSHPATSAEIRTLCKDLQVLGRSEFKQLLRWRLAVRKALKGDLGVVEDGAKVGWAGLGRTGLGWGRGHCAN